MVKPDHDVLTPIHPALTIGNNYCFGAGCYCCSCFMANF